MADVTTGEVHSDWMTARHKNLEFNIHTKGRIEITGSLHKYWNAGEHNYNDFTIDNIRETIQHLEHSFNIEPNTARLSNLEYGVNIMTPFDPNDFLKSLICYKFQSFNKMNIKGGFGNDCSLTQYRIKIYNKGLQFNQSRHILRFEKSIKKMEVLSKKHPVFLIDLIDPELHEICRNQLLAAFDDILFNETLNKTILNKPKLKCYNLINNETERLNLNAKGRCDYKKKFNELISQHGKQNFRPLLIDLINEKIDFLKKGNVLTGV
ncbi:hypothetical protein [Mucilaginibacter polytrichastri]|uniref:hypothetical protein n=1 Tax=Mucilaginibacter polytrichastri TaxID=1302689 RepID=UPI0011151D7C|nr:hypothetical protein [Mucilaginibacter polytrichastri]